MKSETISSREFNQDLARAKRAALRGPVIITDRGKPAHVLLSIQEYRRLTSNERPITELLGDADAAEVELPLDEVRAGWGNWNVPELD